MASVLSSFFARDPKSQFAYDLSESDGLEFNGTKINSSFKKAEPSELATVFSASGNEGQHLKRLAQKMKTLRHPNVLTFHDSLEVENSFYLVTEKCLPLHHYLGSLDLSGSQKEFVVSWGLFQIMSGLKFLHEAKLSHQNVREAVYVTAGGDWKLAALHGVSEFTTSQQDLNQLALVIWEVFNGFNSQIVKPQQPGKIPARLVDLYKKMATPSAARISVDSLIRECRLAGGFFKNKFVDTLLFLEEFQLKEASEKQTFFMHLRENLDIFPPDVAKYKLLPKLILAYEYGDAGPNILIPLFRLGRLLEEEEYQLRIVPCLVKLFSSSDRVTRVKLLERIDEFGAHLTPSVVNDKIFSNLVSGFLDTSPAVRESTVKAMVTLAEKLNFNNLNVELMKYLARLQGGDEHGGIRTNTTICMGKIGGFLDPSKRQTILLSAFTRGMKDPFPPARMAAVLALSATQQFYTLMDIANRVLPAVSPLCCDPEKQVRDQAFKTIRGFMEKLEKASENPELIPELEAGVKAGGRSLLSSDKVPQWASWALKSLSGKFYKGTPPPPVQPAAGEPPAGTDGGQPSSEAAPVPSSASGGPAVTSSGTSDGWGDMDDGDSTGNDDGWADAEEGQVDEDDWSSGWENNPKPAVSVKPAAPLKVAPKKAVGGLKLTPKVVKKAEPVDPVAEMLGSSSISSIRKSSNTSNVSGGPSTVPSGWDDDGTSGGGGGWDDSGWGESSPSAPAAQLKSTLNLRDKDKETRRAEAAARQEARKKELAEKKAARGAMKLAKTEKKMDDFADW